MTKSEHRENWIDYLRSFIILTVVIHHAALSYTTFAHCNEDAYILSSHPIVDTQRWIGFDILVYFNDIFFMSLMFLLSGLFIISGLKRKGAGLFISDRFRRLFIPFIIGVTVIALIAYYPAYISYHDSNLGNYIVDFFTNEFWPPGPAWFLWVLFIFNLIFVWIYPRISALVEGLSYRFMKLINKPVSLFVFWFIITWIVYVPFRLLFGPEGWASFGPFDFQISRLLLYFGYFSLGIVVGVVPFDKGLLSDNSSLMRIWPILIVLSLAAFFSLLIIDVPLKKLVQAGSISDLSSNLIISSLFVASCVFSSAAFLTTAKAIFRRKNKFWDTVTANSFTIYLTHYIFIIWVQYILLNLDAAPTLKFLIVTFASFGLSIMASHYLHKSKILSRLL